MLWNTARLDTLVTVVDASNFPAMMTSLEKFKEKFATEADGDDEGEKHISQLLLDRRRRSKRTFWSDAASLDCRSPYRVHVLGVSSASMNYEEEEEGDEKCAASRPLPSKSCGN